MEQIECLKVGVSKLQEKPLQILVQSEEDLAEARRSLILQMFCSLPRPKLNLIHTF